MDAKENKMEKGETVRVYQDPITCKDFEGYAKLIEPKPKKRDIKGLTETWLVKFEDGTKVERTINLETNNFAPNKGKAEDLTVDNIKDFYPNLDWKINKEDEKTVMKGTTKAGHTMTVTLEAGKDPIFKYEKKGIGVSL